MLLHDTFLFTLIKSVLKFLMLIYRFYQKKKPKYLMQWHSYIFKNVLWATVNKIECMQT